MEEKQWKKLRELPVKCKMLVIEGIERHIKSESEIYEIVNKKKSNCTELTNKHLNCIDDDLNLFIRIWGYDWFKSQDCDAYMLAWAGCVVDGCIDAIIDKDNTTYLMGMSTANRQFLFGIIERELKDHDCLFNDDKISMLQATINVSQLTKRHSESKKYAQLIEHFYNCHVNKMFAQENEFRII